MEENMIPVEETPAQEAVAEVPAVEETPAQEAATEVPAGEEAPAEEAVAEAPADDAKKVEVVCCKCGVKLKVKIGTELCMCPKCGEIFKVKASVRRVKDVSPKQLTKAYVKVDRDEKGNVKTTTVLQ